jgi:NAD(P)-dependent dehydrogenase (short-subunit alcohol dehydrogenase family)
MTATAAPTAIVTAIVTGAGSGIGRAIADRLAADGMAVLAVDLNAAAAEETAHRIRSAGGTARAHVADVADPAAMDGMAAASLAWTGRIDAAVANAGIMVEGDILSVSPDDWARVMAVNATGAFLTARAVLPAMLAQGRGALVFTASTVALAGMKGVAAYSASKGAVAALTRQIAADYAARGIRSNAIAPGAVRTPLSESQFRARAADEAQFQALLDQVIARYPIPRWGTPADIAEVALFLATDRSAWMTGQILPVDGGLLEIR